MDVILQKFSGKIDAKSLVATVEEIKMEYLDDGFTKEDIPPILGRLMLETNKFKNLPGPQKKKLVIGVLNHLIEQIDKGPKIPSLKRFSRVWSPRWSIRSQPCSKRRRVSPSVCHASPKLT
jgi:hypothetical protein